MAFVKVISYEEAEGSLRKIYDDIISSRGRLAEVHKAQSLNPESIVHHMQLYRHLMFGQSPLKRYQREMLGTAVSVANHCAYCVGHHAEALNHFWKDRDRINRFIGDPEAANLDERDSGLVHLAMKMTLQPEKISSADIDGLKEVGLEDRAILDAQMIIAYFNFVNRLMLGLGIDLEEDGGKGYHYD